MNSRCLPYVILLVALCLALPAIPDGLTIVALDSDAKWEQKTWNGTADYSRDQDGGRDGTAGLSIMSDEGGDASWFVIVPIEPWSTYRLSGWIRTQDVEAGSGRGALLNLHNFQGVQTDAITGTTDWTEVAVEFETGEETEVWINCLFGGWGQSTGKAWFDDLKLEQLSKADLHPSVTIHLDQQKTPISKYVYGQFIEHLGRCIYGGIWAEMLEDRKFFEAVGTEESFWKVDGSVSMVTEDALAGDHMPRLSAESQIFQPNLSLKKNTYYAGYVVVRLAEGDSQMRVTLSWPGNEATESFSDLTPAWQKYPFRFYAGADTGEAKLTLAATGPGAVDIGAVSLMPADHVHGMRADVLALLKELDSPVYRWPGGNFVSGYDWRDGIGDRDKRPPRKNPAWQGIEHNDFGLDEFMRFCDELDTEAYVLVNSGQGDLEMALAELEYCNGAADTPWGKVRAENGHPEPYDVVWWGVGNEMYGDWQIGHMPLEDYVKKHNRFAKAMEAQSPGIKLIAVGATGPWSETMLAQCADHMDLLSEHFYCGEKPGLYAHVAQIPRSIEMKVQAHKRYHEEIPALQGKHIAICMDEWNYWYGDHVYGELGTQYFLKDALGIAAGLHAFYDASDWVFMANYAQTVNVIGCIKTTPTDAAFDTTGLVLKLYRAEYGSVPVTIEGDTRPLFVAAALTDDGQALTLSVVNPTLDEQELPIEFSGGPVTARGRHWIITGTGPMAHNVPGKQPEVSIGETTAEPLENTLSVAPISINLYRIPLDN
jgi:alpha-N-arabinofuranosidase